MARLCVRIAPNDHPTDPALNPLRSQPGDVISICEDDHKWSTGELNCGQYRFVDLPGVLPEDLAHLAASEVDAENKLIRKRSISLDLKSSKTIFTKAEIDAAIITKV